MQQNCKTLCCRLVFCEGRQNEKKKSQVLLLSARLKFDDAGANPDTLNIHFTE